MDDVPWGEMPFVPEGKGSPERQARRRDIWRSVIMQQLQADVFACEMASQLLAAAPDPEARLYYSTMVQDESRHTEAWLRLIGQVGGEGERDPYLDELAHMFLEADLLEEKVFLMQVFFERLIIPRFRLIAQLVARDGARGSLQPARGRRRHPPRRRDGVRAGAAASRPGRRCARGSSTRRTRCCRSSRSTSSGGRRRAR